MAHSWPAHPTHAGAINGQSPRLPHAPRSSFTCSLCGECYRVDYHGRQPPFCPQIVFLEDVFCMTDPFSIGGGEAAGNNRKRLPTVVGGTCSCCSKEVCAQCSFFYAVRFCGPCAREHKSRLPPEVHRAVDATGGGMPKAALQETGGRS